LLDKSLEEQSDAADELAEAHRNFKDAKKWFNEAEAQFQKCAADVRTRTEKMREEELKEPCEWNIMYERLSNFRKERGHTNIVPCRKRKAKNSGQRKKRRKVDKKSEGKEDNGNELGMDNSCEDKQSEVKVTEGEAAITEGEGDSEKESDNSDIGEDNEDGKDNGESDEDNGDPDKKELGQWLEQQRHGYRHKNMKTKFPHRVNALEQLGVILDLREAKWAMMFERLQQFHKRHGHINVPWNPFTVQELNSTAICENKLDEHDMKLGKWLTNQRRHYRYGTMKSRFPHRVSALEQLGIEWNQREEKWAKMYGELQDFKAIHGHTDVPIKYSRNLYDWVNMQREKTRLNPNQVQEGGQPDSSASVPSKELVERVRLLEEIGFNWGPRNKSWEDHFSDLCAFRELNGHCDVPEKYGLDPKLGHWVRNQRKFYKRREYMTEDRKRMLESIGFRWSLVRSWDERFEELLAFKAQFGHVAVSRYGDHPSLGLWVRKQKGYFRKYEKGERAPITEEQVEKLFIVGLLVRKPIG